MDPALVIFTYLHLLAEWLQKLKRERKKLVGAEGGRNDENPCSCGC